MGPIVKEMSNAYAGKSIEFVTFDYTTKEAKATAVATAKRLGVETIYTKNRGTGFLLLVDTKSGKVLARLTAETKPAEWRAAIDKGLAGA